MALRRSLAALAATFLFTTSSSQVSPLAEPCGQPFPNGAVCINHYSSVMPLPFSRPPLNGNVDATYGSTSVPNDLSFAIVENATFLVFDRQRGMEILNNASSNDFIFQVPAITHEAPVYVAKQNKLYFSALAPNITNQLVIDLSKQPFTLQNFTSDPPVYGVNGGTFASGSIYWAAGGGTSDLNGLQQRPGIFKVDPETNKSEAILNNYFGWYFNSPDDLFVDPFGNVWFTDPDYGWFLGIDDTAPMLETATYRFNPTTGAVNIVEDSAVQPNGIARSSDGTKIYISDTGAANGPVEQSLGSQGFSLNATGKRVIYAYDVCDNGLSITNKRTIYQALDFGADGLKVAQNGLIVTATGKGVDVLDEVGTPIIRVQTNYSVENFAWTGDELKTLWMTGAGGISKVEWNLQGQRLV